MKAENSEYARTQKLGVSLRLNALEIIRIGQQKSTLMHSLPFMSIIVPSLILFAFTSPARLRAVSEDEMQLTKSNDRKIAGVCGGIAEWLGWSAASVRALFVIVSLFFLGIGGVLLYALLAWTMPPPRNFNLEDFRAQ